MATGDFYVTSASATTTDSTWSVWVDQGTSTSTTIAWSSWMSNSDATTGTVWYHWADQTNVYIPCAAPVPQGPSEEQLAESRARARALAEEEKEAKERADKLLREHLTEAQRAQLDKDNAFDVESASGNKYLITRGRAGNVYSLDAKRNKLAKHCIHPVENCPDQDTMLAQLLWLKWNEAEFLKVANTTRIAA